MLVVLTQSFFGYWLCAVLLFCVCLHREIVLLVLWWQWWWWALVCHNTFGTLLTVLSHVLSDKKYLLDVIRAKNHFLAFGVESSMCDEYGQGNDHDCVNRWPINIWLDVGRIETSDWKGYETTIDVIVVCRVLAKRTFGRRRWSCNRIIEQNLVD